MKYLLPVLLFCNNAFAEITAITGRVYDGDTFAAEIILDGAKVRANIRFINIDAPELKGECEEETIWAYRAKDRLAELIPAGSIVRLENLKDDKYPGRVNANVILPGGRDAGDVLVSEGLAVYYGGGKRINWCNETKE